MSTERSGGPLYHFFSGKGGVGKTTLAAATAVHLARQGLRVLITSTDPAHNLSDVFDRTVGHGGCDIEPNLRALEVDSTARWAEATLVPQEGDGPRRKRGRIESALGDALRMMGDAPGVDEFVSLELLIETMTSDAFDTVVFDTAPTGHTLRLLVLPEMLDGWLGRILTLKTQISRMGRVFRKLLPGGQTDEAPDLGENLMGARDRIAQARRLITDPDRTLFALVTIPEALSVLETQRTIEALGQHRIPVGVVIANQVQPDSDRCEHCHLRHQIHKRELGRLAEVCGDLPLRLVSSKPRVLRGPDELAGLGRELWGEPAAQN
jgi:arsenite-transporting ATPase